MLLLTVIDLLIALTSVVVIPSFETAVSSSVMVKIVS